MVRSGVTKPKTVEEARRDFAQRGAMTTFVCRPISHVECQACGAETMAGPEMLHGMHRIVGDAEDAMVAFVRCPSCHAMGTVTVAAGPASREEEAGVLAALLDGDSPFVAGR